MDKINFDNFCSIFHTVYFTLVSKGGVMTMKLKLCKLIWKV